MHPKEVSPNIIIIACVHDWLYISHLSFDLYHPEVVLCGVYEVCRLYRTATLAGGDNIIVYYFLVIFGINGCFPKMTNFWNWSWWHLLLHCSPSKSLYTCGCCSLSYVTLKKGATNLATAQVDQNPCYSTAALVLCL